MYVFILTELNEVLDRIKQGSSRSSQRIETSDTSDDETSTRNGRRKILSMKNFQKEKVYGANVLDRLFVTGPTDAANKPSHFYCRVCRNGLWVLTHGHHELLRHFQGARHFARDQRLVLDIHSWRVLEFHGDPLKDGELERQKGKLNKGTRVVPDCGHPFAEDLIADMAGVVDTELPIFAKASCLMDASNMGGSYELVERVWAQFVLTSRRVNAERVWMRDGVLVNSVKIPESLRFFSDLHCCFAFNR